MNNILKTSLLATAGLVSTITAAQAQTALSAANGDFFLGFRATSGTGANEDYLLDLGPVSTIEAATSFITFSLGNVNADLTGVFGANWQNDASLLWGAGASNTAGGVVATGNTDPKDTLYATAADPSSPWIDKPVNTQATTSGKFNLLSQAFVTNQSNSTQNVSTTNSPVGLIQNTSDTNSWASYNTGASSFGAFNPTIENGFANGTPGATLDLYVLQPHTGNPVATELGTITIDNGAAITYSPAPEPSSAAIFAIGMGVLGFARRRKSVVS